MKTGYLLAALALVLALPLASGAIVPNTSPCWVKGNVSSSDFTVGDLTVTAYEGDTALENGSVASDGEYEINSVGANDGDTIDLKVYGHSFTSFTFQGYCETSGDPWIYEDLSVSKQANGEACNNDLICTSGNCDSGTCSAESTEETTTDDSSGGGGGGASSGYFDAPSATTDLGAVASGERRDATISDQDVPVKRVTLTAATQGANVRITVSTPSSAPTSFAGRTYKTVQIDHDEGFIAEDVEIEFTVENSWLADNDAQAADVRLYRLVDDEWVELETTVQEEGSAETTFVAQSPGLSYFTIGTADDEPDAPTQDTTTDEPGDEPDTTTPPEEPAEEDNQTTPPKAPAEDGTSPWVWASLAIVALILVVALYMRSGGKKSAYDH